MQARRSDPSRETWHHNTEKHPRDWLVYMGKKLVRSKRMVVKPPTWEEAKLDRGLDAISFLFKSYRVSAKD
jgi:hypothetical protein